MDVHISGVQIDDALELVLLPVYLLTRAEFSSAAEQMRVLESGRDLWAIDFRFVDPTETDVVRSHPEGPSFSVDARTRRVELWYQM